MCMGTVKWACEKKRRTRELWFLSQCEYEEGIDLKVEN